MSDAVLYVQLLAAGGLLLLGVYLLRISLAVLFMSRQECENIKQEERNRKRFAIYYRKR